MNCEDYLKMDVPFTKKGDAIYNMIRMDQNAVDFSKRARAAKLSGLTDPQEIIHACFTGASWKWIFPLEKYPQADIVFNTLLFYAFNDSALACLPEWMDPLRMVPIDNGYTI